MDSRGSFTDKEQLERLIAVRRQANNANRIKPRESFEPPLLSFAQEQLWFLYRLDPSSTVYNRCPALRLHGALDTERLQKALNAVLARHEILRAGFREENGQVIQFFRSQASLTLEKMSVLSDSPDKKEQTARNLCKQFVGKVFDLEHDLLVRAALIQIDIQDHILVLAVHHIVSDGWSDSLFFSDLTKVYATHSELPATEIGYADFALWQRKRIAERADKLLETWKKRLEGFPTCLEIPTDYKRPPTQPTRGDRVSIGDSVQLQKLVSDLATRLEVTPYAILLTVLQVALSRLTSISKFLIGTPVAGRITKESEMIMGCFVNTLVLRADVSDNPSFADLARRSVMEIMEALTLQELPFEYLVKGLRLERDMSRAPLVQVTFGLHNTPPSHSDFLGLTVDRFPLHASGTQTDLNFSVLARDGKLEGEIEFATDLWDRSTIEALAYHVRTLLESAVENPNIPISNLDHGMIIKNASGTPLDTPESVVTEIILQARHHPDHVAVEAVDSTLVYRDLMSQANVIAALLTRAGVKQGDRVGICLERKSSLVVSVVGIWQVGAAYVPLDPQLPAERLSFIINDAQLTTLICSETTKMLGDQQLNRVIYPQMTTSQFSCEIPSPIENRGDDIAYMIYTSGSTGKPKGVPIKHSSLANLLFSFRKIIPFKEQDRLLAITTPSFDIAWLELLLPIISGGTVIIVDEKSLANSTSLAAYIAQRHPTVMQATPATWGMLIDGGWVGQPNMVALCGGESLPRLLVKPLLERVGSLLSVYGPTETTIWSMAYWVRNYSEQPLLGQPINNTQVYIVDSHGQPCMTGAVGELVIGGLGLSSGYWRRPDLVMERFINNLPFKKGMRFYRTGDLARYRGNGEIEFKGRNDFQVKIRGFRIELGEIEATLESAPDVLGSVVSTIGEDLGRILVAYIRVADPSNYNLQSLKAHLASNLPAHMVPKQFVVLSHFPLTPNGKIDRKALPKPTLNEIRSVAVTNSATEKQVEKLWKEILNLSRVGREEDFFQLGGHSLLAVRLLAQIEAEFGCRISIREMFEQPTIAAMALHLDGVRSVPQTAKIMLEDAQVPIQLKAQHRRNDDGVGVTLITGVTGFVGVHLFAEIVRSNQYGKIVVVVRAEDQASALVRLKKTLVSYQLDATLTDKVIIVHGDLEGKYSAQTWSHIRLATDGKLRHIFHSAAIVNFSMPYLTLRGMNVDVVTALAELAFEQGASFDHISTIYIADAADLSIARPIAETAKLEAPHQLMLGYVQSKWVAEERLARAAENGLTVRLHRLGRIGGASEAAICPMTDLVWSFVFAVVQLGFAPDIDAEIDILPVDIAINAILALHESDSVVNHIIAGGSIGLQDLIQLLEDRGYQIEKCDWNQWRQKMLCSTDSRIAPLAALLPADEAAAASIFGAARRFSNNLTTHRLSQKGIRLMPTTLSIIARTLNHFITNGMLPIPEKIKEKY